MKDRRVESKVYLSFDSMTHLPCDLGQVSLNLHILTEFTTLSKRHWTEIRDLQPSTHKPFGNLISFSLTLNVL